jgi:hypothetical protein
MQNSGVRIQDGPHVSFEQFTDFFHQAGWLSNISMSEIVDKYQIATRFFEGLLSEIEKRIAGSLILASEF